MELPLDIVINNIEDSFEASKLYLFKNKESCIDCNQPIFLTKEELLAKIEGSIEFIEVTMDMSLKEKIIQAIKKSLMVRDEIKDSICLKK